MSPSPTHDDEAEGVGNTIPPIDSSAVGAATITTPVVEVNDETRESAYLASKVREKHDAALNDMVPQKTRIRNRRRRYLELHPEYLDDTGLELADPLLYDRLIRRFQTATERESEGRKKGYSGILEADLYRGEAKLNALRNPDPNSNTTYKRGANGEILAEEADEVPNSKVEGMTRWRYEMERRFVEGRDEDFDYSKVDKTSEYDDKGAEDREAEERWFDQEEESWIEGDDDDNNNNDNDNKKEMTPNGKRLQGETGVQDF